jgi:folate-binding protein YgfZ
MNTPVGDGRADGQVRAEYAALRSTAAAHLLSRDVVRVSGPDAASYLQGQCSQDVEALEPGESADALLLSPQGKVEVFVRVTRVGDDFVIDTDEGYGEAVVARLQRFRLRVKVEFEPLAWVCAALRGPGAAGGVAGSAPVVVPVEWPGLSGLDLLGPPPAGGLNEWIADQVVVCGDEAWEAARIEAGIPRNGREIVEGTIAAEVGLVDRAVSFTKGCFTGQELVARLDARGSNVARRLCGIVLDGPAAGGSWAPVGATVSTTDGEHEVGRLSSVARSPGSGAGVGLAVVHRRVTPPAEVLVSWTTNDGSTVTAQAEARPLPLVG